MISLLDIKSILCYFHNINRKVLIMTKEQMRIEIAAVIDDYIAQGKCITICRYAPSKQRRKMGRYAIAVPSKKIGKQNCFGVRV